MAAICRSTIIKERTPLKSEWALRSLRNDHAVYVGIGTPLISEWLRRSAGICIKRGVKATILGYDLKEDVVEHCNAIAQKYGYDGLRFVVSDVTRDTLADTHVDMVVTLHACDTATDYALWYAVEKGVKHIFSVPCCQHEINATIHKGGDFDVLLRHGLLQERFSALLTDSIRAAVLEDMGYTVDVIEFIDFAHSPKNLMLRCVKDRRAGERNLSAARELAEKYGFRQTLLELAEKKRLSAQNTAP